MKLIIWNLSQVVLEKFSSKTFQVIPNNLKRLLLFGTKLYLYVVCCTFTYIGTDYSIYGRQDCRHTLLVCRYCCLMAINIFMSCLSLILSFAFLRWFGSWLSHIPAWNFIIFTWSGAVERFKERFKDYSTTILIMMTLERRENVYLWPTQNTADRKEWSTLSHVVKSQLQAPKAHPS